MEKWIYEVMVLSGEVKDIEKALNSKGNNGWELVCVNEPSFYIEGVPDEVAGYCMMAFFKKKA